MELLKMQMVKIHHQLQFGVAYATIAINLDHSIPF